MSESLATDELMKMYNLGIQHGRNLERKEIELEQLKKEVEELINE
jgi:hypothetical protein